MEFKGIGPTGADIFLREVQSVWPDVGPYADARVSEGAKKLGLPATPRGLARLADSPKDMAAIASALVRVARGSRAAEHIKRSAAK
jgi:hypothetical protein